MHRAHRGGPPYWAMPGTGSRVSGSRICWRSEIGDLMPARPRGPPPLTQSLQARGPLQELGQVPGALDPVAKSSLLSRLPFQVEGQRQIRGGAGSSCWTKSCRRECPRFGRP